MPKNAMSHIQNTAPGPPTAMAPATPTILPVPTVAASAVHRDWNWEMLRSSVCLVIFRSLKMDPIVFFSQCPRWDSWKKSSHTGHQHSRKAQQNQCGPAPYHIIDCTIYIGNHFNHRLFLLTRANFPKFHIQERLLLGRPFYITGIFRYIKNGDSLYPAVSVDIPLFYFLRDFLYLIIEDAGGSSYFFCISVNSSSNLENILL